MRNGKRIAKQVDFFLFDYLGGDVEDHDHEVEEARWMPLEEAAKAPHLRGRAGDGGPRPVADQLRRVVSGVGCRS